MTDSDIKSVFPENRPARRPTREEEAVIEANLEKAKRAYQKQLEAGEPVPKPKGKVGRPKGKTSLANLGIAKDLYETGMDLDTIATIANLSKRQVIEAARRNKWRRAEAVAIEQADKTMQSIVRGELRALKPIVQDVAREAIKNIGESGIRVGNKFAAKIEKLIEYEEDPRALNLLGRALKDADDVRRRAAGMDDWYKGAIPKDMFITVLGGMQSKPDELAKVEATPIEAEIVDNKPKDTQ